ncbi:protein kinase [Colletotrichum camelliae]|nr:protein kinase [Colletotrichum camelliae]
MDVDHGFDRVPTGLDNGDLSTVEKQKKSSTLSEGQTTIHDHGDTARLSQHTGDEQSEDPDPSQSDLAGIGGASALGDSESVVSRNLQLSDSDSDDAEGLWTVIDDKLIQPPPHDGKKFLPLDDLRKSIARPQVRRALRKSPAFSDDEVHEYANHVCDTTQVANTQRTTRQRMFATLVLIEHLEALRSFVEEKLHDIHLPFKLQREKHGIKWLLFYKATDGELVQFQGSSAWRNSKVKSFYDKQWLVLSPFFDMKAGKPLFYPLESMVILPFVEGSEGQPNTAFGGFGTVWRVKIHHAHHNYDNRSDPAFAIKKLHSNNKEEFDRELLALKKFNRLEHPNLMKLLATYQHHEHRFFVFPWADGNLREFWQSHPTPQRTHNLVVWMADQVCGIASGLQLIQHPPKDDALTVQDFRNFGRHGDLKPENVLWFRDDSQGKDFPDGGLLKIADFGLTRYHHDRSKSDVNARGLGVSLTYKAPEYDVRSSVSQAYDIWTLGLLLLEFITWYLEGWDSVDQFSKNRAEEDDQNEIPLDTFYNLVYTHPDAIAGAELKKSVREEAIVEEELRSREEWEAWLGRAEVDSRDDELNTVHIMKDAEFLHCTQLDDKQEPDSVVYNYRTSASFADDVAVSVTHEPRFRSTMSIFFGLSGDQEHTLTERMKDSLRDLSHPLALIGAACELERDRLIKGQVRPIETEYLEKSLKWCDVSSIELASDVESETMGQVLELRFKSSDLLTSLAASRQQMTRIRDHLTELHASGRIMRLLTGNRLLVTEDKDDIGRVDLARLQSHTAARLHQRLNQITDELSMKFDSCQGSMEDMMATTQVVISRIARHDAKVNTDISVATRRDNSQMRSIAFVTMIFLPLTSIATIFSMNVFNWQATDSEHLINVHFWLYLAVAGTSTILTVGLWMCYTGMRKGIFGKRKDGESGSDTESQIATNV